MSHIIEIKTDDYALIGSSIQNSREFQTIWTLGDLDILKVPLTGIFCSIQCPGNVILRIYDLIRALRGANIPVISGFQSPMEKECLDLLLRGQQPVVICPARTIENMRIPTAWRPALEANRLLILSPFEPKHRRSTKKLAEKRNRFAAMLSKHIILPHASQNGTLTTLCSNWITSGRTVYTLNLPGNTHLTQIGATAKSITELTAALT